MALLLRSRFRLPAPPTTRIPANNSPASLKKLVERIHGRGQQPADPVDPSIAFYQGAIPGMLRTLDPHSIFFDPGQFQQLKQMENSEQKGFGTIVSVLPGRVIVLQACPGRRRQKAGLVARRRDPRHQRVHSLAARIRAAGPVAGQGAAAAGRAGCAPRPAIALSSPDARRPDWWTRPASTVFPARARHRLPAHHQFR